MINQRYRIFFYSWKRLLSCHFRSKLSEWVKMVYFFSDLYFFSGSRILGGWWDLDQLRHFSRKKLKNILEKKKNTAPGKKITVFSRFEWVSGHNLFQRKKNTVIFFSATEKLNTFSHFSLTVKNNWSSNWPFFF